MLSSISLWRIFKVPMGTVLYRPVANCMLWACLASRLRADHYPRRIAAASLKLGDHNYSQWIETNYPQRIDRNHANVVKGLVLAFFYRRNALLARWQGPQRHLFLSRYQASCLPQPSSTGSCG